MRGNVLGCVVVLGKNWLSNLGFWDRGPDEKLLFCDLDAGFVLSRFSSGS